MQNSSSKNIKLISSQIFDEVICLNVDKLPSEIEHKFIERQFYCWAIALHIFIRKFDKEHYIPAKKPFIDILRARGCYLYELFELCSACHARQEQLPLKDFYPYATAADWFISIFNEILSQVANEIIFPEPLRKTSVRYEKHTPKDDILDLLRKALRSTRRGENPYAGPEMKHIAHLISAGITLRDQSPEFSNRHFKPFLNAWKDHIDKLDSPTYKFVMISGDNLVMNYPGRRKKIIA